MLAIGMCVDEQYLVPALVAIVSMADALPPKERASVAIRILTTDMPPGRVCTMAAVVKRLGYESFDIQRDQPHRSHIIVAGKHISTTTYLRFHFSRRFVGRPYLAYIDADVLIMGDITVPFNGVNGRSVGLVRDFMNHTVGRGPALPGLALRYPHWKGQPYFNAGMMWCQTEALPPIRQAIHRIMTYDRRHIHFNYQDALNLWALRTQDVYPVDSSFNTFELGRFRETGDWIDRVARPVPVNSSPAVLHYVGPDKPWHRHCPDTPGVRLYRSTLRQTMTLVRRTGDQTLILPGREHR